MVIVFSSTCPHVCRPTPLDLKEMKWVLGRRPLPIGRCGSRCYGDLWLWMEATAYRREREKGPHDASVAVWKASNNARGNADMWHGISNANGRKSCPGKWEWFAVQHVAWHCVGGIREGGILTSGMGCTFETHSEVVDPGTDDRDVAETT